MIQVLTIAGSDSGAGAGIQADLMAFRANGVYGTSAITAVTAQNTVGVARADSLPPELVAAQVNSVFADFQVRAAKTGMLGSAEIVRTVVTLLQSGTRRRNLVVDPVMISTSGHRLLSPLGVDALVELLLPLCTLVTPNVQEAEVLAGMSITTREDVRTAARRIAGMGPRAVLVKGGHLPSAPGVDTLFRDGQFREFTSDFVHTSATHGSGCVYSAAICAHLGRGRPLEDAIALGKIFVSGAIAGGLRIGSGHGPVDPFYFLNGDSLPQSRGE